ncbi:tRNA N(3)-methylcytidine methyltransferase trm141-like isoform X2 [Lycium barbarum]|uniref:tRNA N(3)-methylcytidine methyltransferase trm141-like isoform X2 n=1 Tax=Lycium barbarum TaxID=112863 RepID=UPI00293F37F7|nr:tRNA N(3)-methylcytidine methyltransferase trm141-like isoform X2 [Lycium barbarum]
MHAAGGPPVRVSPSNWAAPRVGRRYLTIGCWTSLTSNSENHHYSRRSQQYWDKFYKLHNNKFFKDRHYLEKDWRSYFDDEIESSNGKVVLEVGCGAGNTIFPLVTTFPKLYIHACDFSPKAITLVKSHENYSAKKMNVFVCDAAKDDLSDNVTPFTVDVVTLIFTLSAVSPSKMASVLENCKQVLKPNGHILLRDYAVGDSAQVKLHDRNQMISENFYFRGDGTCSFYFSEAYASTLFESAGFAIVDINTYCKEITNHSRNITMQRRWIRAIFSCS